MPKLRYQVKLTKEERVKLTKTTTTGRASAKEILHAKILLATDDGRSPKLTVVAVAEKCDTTTTTVQTIRRSYAEQGLDAALKRKKRESPPIQPKITGEV